MLAADADFDLSLLEIDNGPFQYIPVAPKGFQPGRNVASAGYDNMHWPITQKAATIVGSGDNWTFTREKPWHGRSGGGLFDLDAKRLIGVVNGYEVNHGQRGIYVSHDAVVKFIFAALGKTDHDTPNASSARAFPSYPGTTEFATPFARMDDVCEVTAELSRHRVQQKATIVTESPPMKPGWKTTEFWQTIIAQVLGFLAFAGVISTNDSQTLEEALGKSVAAIFTLIVNGMVVVSYVRTRFHLKALIGETPRSLKVLVLLAGLGCCLIGAPAQAQMLPWRQSITQQLKQHEALLNNLKNAPTPAPQIIVVAPAYPPFPQSLPIRGATPAAIPRFRVSRSRASPSRDNRRQQSFPFQGQPKQELPIQGQPPQPLPDPRTAPTSSRHAAQRADRTASLFASIRPLPTH